MQIIKTLGELIWERFRVFPDTSAYATASGAVRVAELFSDAWTTARAASELGQSRSLAVYVADLPGFITAVYAGFLSGRPLFLFSTEISPDEIGNLMRFYRIGGLITNHPGPWPDGFVLITPKLATGNVLTGVPPLAIPAVDDTALVLMTSGTTGTRRAVPITHRNLIWTGLKFNDMLGLTSGHHELVMVPLSHSFGVRRIVAQLLCNGCVSALSGTFNPALVLVLLREHHYDVLSAVPAQIRLLIGRYRKEFEQYGRSIRHMELSSAFMSQEEKVALARLLPNANLVMGYGLTEATRAALLNLRRDSARLHTVGRPFEGIEHVIVDENGRELPRGITGEILIRGSNVIKGYLGEGGAICPPFFDRGFPTGDLGCIDDDGFLHLMGRKDDVINVGGKKFHPSELETLVATHYPRLDFAISHRRCDILGMKPVLCVSGHVPDTREVVELIARRCEPYKCPTDVLALPEIPRTENGKVQRGRLKQLVDSFKPAVVSG